MGSPPYFQKIYQFLSLFSLTLGFGWLYTLSIAHKQPKFVLKILDWALIAFSLSMMLSFEILGLPFSFWIPLLVGSIVARMVVARWVQGKDFLKSPAKKQLRLKRIFLYLAIAMFIVPLFGLGFYYKFSERYGLPVDSRFIIKGVIVNGILIEPERLTPLTNLILITCISLGIILFILAPKKQGSNTEKDPYTQKDQPNKKAT